MLVIFVLFSVLILLDLYNGKLYVYRDFSTISNNFLLHSVSITNDSNKPVELYQIMNKQYYGIRHGKYGGVPYKKILFWNHFKTLNDDREYGVGLGKDGYV